MIEMTLEQHQVALYSKIKVAYNLLKAYKPKNDGTWKSYFEDDTKIESYKMLIVNYIVALLGNRKNDKCSFNLNYPSEIADFRKNNADNIENLEVIRDKVYSHFDLDYVEKSKLMSYEFIEQCIEFISVIVEKINKEHNYWL